MQPLRHWLGVKLVVGRSWRQCSQQTRQTALRYLRAAIFLLNLHTLTLAAVGCLAVYACERWSLSFNIDFNLIAVGCTFPLVFTIQQSFTRRERALSLIANLKASAVALWLIHRDWCLEEGSLGNPHHLGALQCKALLRELLQDTRTYLTAQTLHASIAEQRMSGSTRTREAADLLWADISLPGASQMSFALQPEPERSADPPDAAAAALRRCYRSLSRLSVLAEHTTQRAGYGKGGEGGMSRASQYLRFLIAGLEELRCLKDYRTPVMLRAAHGVLLHLFAVLLAPYFAHFCSSWEADGHDRRTCPSGYVSSVVFCLITMLLFKVQQALEMPFDMHGMDDVFFDVGREMETDVWVPVLAASTQAGSGCCSPRPQCWQAHVAKAGLAEAAHLSRCSSCAVVLDTVTEEAAAGAAARIITKGLTAAGQTCGSETEACDASTSGTSSPQEEGPSQDDEVLLIRAPRSECGG